MGEPAPRERTVADHERVAGDRVDALVRRLEGMPYADRRLPELRQLESLPEEELRSVIVLLFQVAANRPGVIDRLLRRLNRDTPSYAAFQALGAIPARSLRWTPGEAALLLHAFASILDGLEPYDEWRAASVATKPLAAAEAALREVGAEGMEAMRPSLEQVTDGLARFSMYSKTEAAMLRARYAALLGGAKTRVDPKLFDTNDTWGVDWSDRAAAIDGPLASLVSVLGLAAAVTPTARWRREAAELVKVDGAGAMLQAMLGMSVASQALREPVRHVWGDQTFISPFPPLGDANAIIVRGAIWAAALLGEPWVPSLLGEIGVHFGTSGGSSNVARDERLANAAAAALGSMTGRDAGAALGRMKAKVTNRNVSKQIAKALESAATRSGISASELLELAVPTLGLDAGGRREIPIAGHVAVIAIDGDTATLQFRDPTGKTSARPGSEIAASYKAAITAAKLELKEVQKGLAQERGRVEELFVEGREWALGDWRERYLDHPVTSTIGRRLIWSFLDGGATATALPVEGGLRLANGEPFVPGPQARVRLWHPIDASEAEIAAWRGALIDRRIRQPFKQAFREVYRVTEAELETEVYSNRFAGHILRYPQARALMTARRWGSNFLGPFDGGDTGIARREFASHGIRAEFWHGAIVPEAGGLGGDVANCTTDQVRFYPIQPARNVFAAPDPIRIADLPQIVFSEAMRDVDLFVSVTSVGADRNWQDGGRNINRPWDVYWQQYGTGELTATAKVRRDVLQRMLPGLAIAGRVAIQDRWLRVRGDLREYKIHLTSGNIMMEPSDTYLCIVPSRGEGADSARVFLPFDDDPILTIILSKAFLLAADSSIKDQSILSQIRRT
ncbi:MAG TPA: DUF4132 domain-containing protein [Candidatus Limnocylindrales bacterium]|nr:DUF4132 domain-containing protein [Candidatus Limnocylindrales bacterium]